MSQKKKVYLADSAPEEHTLCLCGKLVEIHARSHRKATRPRKVLARGHQHETRNDNAGYPTSQTDVEALVSTSIPRHTESPLPVRPSDKGKVSLSGSGRIMGVARPFAGWNTPEKWRTGHSRSTSTAMSDMMRGMVFSGEEHVDGTIEGAMKRVSKRILRESRVTSDHIIGAQE